MGTFLTRAAAESAPQCAAAPNSRAPLEGVSRLLILLPSWVGDIVMATPLLRAARGALPQARIGVLCRPGLSPLLGGCPWIDEHFEAPMRGAIGPWTGVSAARAFGADAVLLLPNSLRSALAALPLGRRRVGYRRPGRTPLLTHALAPPARARPTPAVDFYADLGAWALGCPIEARHIQLFTTREEEMAACELLGGAAPPSGRRSLLVVNPGANRADKRWPPGKFAEVAARLALTRSLDVAVNGAPSERSLVSQVVSLITARIHAQRAPGARPGTGAARPPVIDLVERGVSLGSLKAVLASAQLLLTNDTGPRHVAAALSTPSIVLFGPTDHRWTTLHAPHPGAHRDRLLLAEPFLPEDQTADRAAELCRIDRISVEDAVHAANQILGPLAV